MHSDIAAPTYRIIFEAIVTEACVVRVLAGLVLSWVLLSVTVRLVEPVPSVVEGVRPVLEITYDDHFSTVTVWYGGHML